jgi:zinc transport system substrate-binding protein
MDASLTGSDLLHYIVPVRLHNILLGLLVVACTHDARAADVLATLKPIHSLTAQAMEGVGVPALLIEGMADPHSYAFRPSDARALSGARLVVMVGPQFETFLARPLASLAPSAKVLALARVADMSLPGGDQHLWLDPTNAARAVGAIGRALAEIDPTHAYEYARNAAWARERLLALDRELRATLEPLRGKPFVVYHDALRGFAAHYGLRLVGAVVTGAEHAARARALAELARKAKAEGATCIFTAPQFEAAEAQALARETGARIWQLDELGAAIPAGPEMYFTLMRGIAATLRDCLG